MSSFQIIYPTPTHMYDVNIIILQLTSKIKMYLTSEKFCAWRRANRHWAQCFIYIFLLNIQKILKCFFL